jgi:hypothetical protein
MAIKTPMMAITTSNSINVKPRHRSNLELNISKNHPQQGK